MDAESLVKRFHQILEDDDQLSAAVAAIRILIEFVELNQAHTLTGLFKDLDEAKKVMMSTESSVASVKSGCELFVRFITLHSKELDVIDDFQSIKEVLLKRSNLFLEKMRGSRRKISQFANQFIVDGSVILVHSYSRVVLNTLQEASTCKQFNVYVTESQPDRSGKKMAEHLKSLGINVTLILDASVGYIMEKIDYVMLGSEGVMESGGIVNKIGSNTICMCAKMMNKPVYVLSESFKFLRLYPLNQQDLPKRFLFGKSVDTSDMNPLVDYTPPIYITLLFTDLGILTTSAVSDELIKLYL